MVAATPGRTARPLKIGLSIAGGEGGMAGETPGWSDILQLAQTAEAAGFDSIWVPDHMIFKPAVGSTTPIGIWECFTVLSALAVATQRVELGTLVASTGFRNPRGPRPGGPPIMIGSVGDRMLALAARYADSWNTWASKTHNDVAGVAPLRQLVDAACVAADRDPATLERTAAVLVEIEGSVPYPPGYPGWNPGAGQPLRGTPEELAAIFRIYAREGIAHLQVWVNPLTPAGIERLAEALAFLDAGEDAGPGR